MSMHGDGVCTFVQVTALLKGGGGNWYPEKLAARKLGAEKLGGLGQNSREIFECLGNLADHVKKNTKEFEHSLEVSPTIQTEA